MTIICKITCHDCKIKIEETEWSFQTLILKSMNCRILLIQNINTHISLIMTTLVHILKLKDIYTLTIDIGIQTTLAFHLKAVYICFVVKPNTTSIYIYPTYGCSHFCCWCLIIIWSVSIQQLLACVKLHNDSVSTGCTVCELCMYVGELLTTTTHSFWLIILKFMHAILLVLLLYNNYHTGIQFVSVICCT